MLLLTLLEIICLVGIVLRVTIVVTARGLLTCSLLMHIAELMMKKNLSPGLSSAKISLRAYSNSTLDFQTMKRAVEAVFRLAFSYCGIFHSPQLDSKEFQ